MSGTTAAPYWLPYKVQLILDQACHGSWWPLSTACLVFVTCAPTFFYDIRPLAKEKRAVTSPAFHSLYVPYPCRTTRLCLGQRARGFITSGITDRCFTGTRLFEFALPNPIGHFVDTFVPIDPLSQALTHREVLQYDTDLGGSVMEKTQRSHSPEQEQEQMFGLESSPRSGYR